jgi:hypothetical protein
MADLNELARLLFALPEAQEDLLRFILPDFLDDYDITQSKQLDTQFVIITGEEDERTELRLDLLFRVPARVPGKPPALFHQELQQGKWEEFQVRMQRYNRMIRGPFSAWSLLSIGITTTRTYRKPGRSPVREETLGGWVTQECWFWHLPAGDLEAADHADLDNPMIQALRANMRWSRRVRKVARLLEILRALRRLVRPGVYRQRLVWWAEASLELTAAQRAEVRSRWRAEIGGDEMERTFVSLFEEESLKRGLAQGLEQGLERGLTQGRQLTLLRLLRRRFGDMPPAAEKRLREITDPVALDDLTDRLLTAASLEELGLSGDGRQA